MTSVRCAVLWLAWVPAPLLAADAPEPHDVCVPGRHCRLASDTELERLRGGFDFDTGKGRRLRVAIGITRSVAVNERVVATSRLVVPDLGRALEASRHGRPAPAGAAGANALIVQNGPGNVAPPAAAFAAAALPTLVQNTLDNQKVSTLTIVNATVNSLSVLNALRTSDMMRRATAASGR